MQDFNKTLLISSEFAVRLLKWKWNAALPQSSKNRIWRMLWAVAWAGILLSPCRAAQSLPQVLTRHEVIGQLPYYYNGAISAFSQKEQFHGSGYAVLPKTVLTAAHVIWDDEKLVWLTDINWNWQYHNNFPPSGGLPMFSQIWTSYADRAAADPSPPGFSGLSTFNADTAALWSFRDIAGGGGGRMRASKVFTNPYLTGNRLKMLTGYPLEQPFIPFTNRHLMHRTPPGNYNFEKDEPLGPGSNDLYGWPWRIYESKSVNSYSGNSGGPLYAFFEDGNWYPVATFVGGSDGVLVRSIEEDVLELVELANEAGGGKGFAFGEKPVLLEAPRGQTVTVGSNLTFSVSVSGSPEPTYQWLKNSAVKISNEDGPSLTLNNVRVPDSGTYSVVIANAAGTVITETIDLMVKEVEQGRPEISEPPVNISVVPGGMTTLKVAASGNAPLSFQWYSGSTGDTLHPIPAATLASFTTPPLEEESFYWVRVSNDAGSEDSATVTVSLAEESVNAVLGGIALGGNFFQSDWYGTYNNTFWPWVYHTEHGFQFVLPAGGDENVYLYDFESSDWWFTSPLLYPTLYSFKRGSFIFYFQDSQHPRRFVDLQSEAFFTIPE